LLKYFGRPLSTVAGTVYDTSSKATEYLTGMDLPNYKEAFPKASEFGPSIGEYVTNKDLKLIGSDDKEKDKDEIDAKIEPPKKDVDEKDEVVIPVEKEETTLDILKRMAQPKEEEGIDIMQAKTGLLDLIAAEDIRTGRAGAEEAAKRITERGLAQQKFEADEINKDFARMVAINELDLKERSLAADNTKAIYKYMMDTLKLRGDQATKVFESLSKNSPMLLSEDMETAIPKLIEQTNSIVGKLGMAPSTTLPSTEDTKIKSPSGITSFIKKLTGTE